MLLLAATGVTLFIVLFLSSDSRKNHCFLATIVEKRHLHQYFFLVYTIVERNSPHFCRPLQYQPLFYQQLNIVDQPQNDSHRINVQITYYIHRLLRRKRKLRLTR